MAIKRLDTISVEIHTEANDVWAFISDVRNWKQFSDFSKDMDQISVNEWVAHTDQGDIRVSMFFDEQHLTLDQVVNLPNGDEQLIPYRVISKGEGGVHLDDDKSTDGSRQRR